MKQTKNEKFQMTNLPKLKFVLIRIEILILRHDDNSFLETNIMARSNNDFEFDSWK